MIYCPNCGTANRDGSSFCNQCGQRFGLGSKTACPACGSDNPIGNLFCEECGARLTPLVTKGAEEKAGVKGLSLPTKPIENALSSEKNAALAGVPSAGPASTEEDEGDIPDWLARLRASAAPESAPAEEQGTHQAPAAPLFSEAAEGSDEETPEWLQSLRSPEPAAPDEVAAIGIPSAEEVPSAAGVPPAEVEPASQEEVSVPPPVEIPTGEVESASQEAMAESIAEVAATEITTEPVQASEPFAELISSRVGEETPAQATTGSAPPLEEPEALAVPEVPAPAQIMEPVTDQPVENLAAWLQKEGPVILEAGEGDEEESETITFQPETPPMGTLSEMPSQLDTLGPEGGVVPDELGRAFIPAGKPAPEDVGLERASIPSWLEDLRPGRKREEHPIEDVVETAGILSGLRGALKMVEAVDPAPGQCARPASTPLVATETQAAMLTRLLGETTSAQLRPHPVASGAKPVRGLPWLAFLLLFAAVLIPFFVPGLAPGGNDVAVSQPAADLVSQIQNLNSGDVVLVSFDYDPGASTELDWPVRVVVESLRAQGAKLLITSLTPTGPGLAARFDLGDTQSILLGYLPGQEMGLRRLAGGLDGVFSADFQGNPVPEAPLGIRSLDDVSLILVAASSQDTVRWWVEQVKTQIPSTPMGVVVSGAIEPAVRPYYASGQLVGLVSGWVGGQAYRHLSSPNAVAGKEDIAAMEAQSFAHLAIILLIVLGNIAYWGKRLFGRQP